MLLCIRFITAHLLVPGYPSFFMLLCIYLVAGVFILGTGFLHLRAEATLPCSAWASYYDGVSYCQCRLYRAWLLVPGFPWALASRHNSNGLLILQGEEVFPRDQPLSPAWQVFFTTGPPSPHPPAGSVKGAGVQGAACSAAVLCSLVKTPALKPHLPPTWPQRVKLLF